MYSCVAVKKTSFRAVAVLLSITPAAMEGQAAPVTLLQPDRGLRAGFTHIAGVRELPDGRVLLLDTGEGKLQLTDSQWTEVVQVGRNGNGPREYASPLHLFALPGGRSALRDWGNSRLLVIAPDGSPSGFLNDRPGLECSGVPARVSRTFVAADSHGRFFTQADPVKRSSEGRFEPTDSAAIERWGPGSCRPDTIAFVPNKWGKGRAVALSNGMITGGPTFVPAPFPSLTAWVL